MALLKSPFTPEERAARRKLIFTDTLSLTTILAITVLLAVAAHFIHESYASHRKSLADRWADRGIAALNRKEPLVAIGALRSALALDPGNQDTEVRLAEALAAAGRTAEAISYFNMLAQSRPGDGIINLQLARLAARQGEEQRALADYQQAIFGDWHGNGYLQRREVRLEMVEYLISRGLFLRARSELLVSAGNAPRNDNAFLIQIAKLMEKSEDPQNGLHLYQQVLQQDPDSLAAMEGAGRTSFDLGAYRQARRYFEQAISHSASRGLQISPGTQELARQTNRLLLLAPLPDLSPRGRALRILENRKIAQARLAACATRLSSKSEPSATGSSQADGDLHPSLLRHPIKNLESHFGKPGGKSAEAVESSPNLALENLQARWKQSKRITLGQLERSRGFAEAQMQLVFDTERITAELCGSPSGDDALLLRLGEAWRPGGAWRITNQ